MRDDNPMATYQIPLVLPVLAVDIDEEAALQQQEPPEKALVCSWHYIWSEVW
jgi:hypothetical protein